MVAIILQARLASSRLKQKALLPLAGHSLLVQVMKRLQQVRADTRILATDSDSAFSFAQRAEENEFELFIGHPLDVLDRYCKAILQYHCDVVIRATGDNPFVAYELPALLIRRQITTQADYSAHSSLPLGMGVEVLTAEAVLRAGREATTAYDREHVCPFMYNNNNKFKIDIPLAPKCYRFPAWLSAERLTIDTQEDYSHIQWLYDQMYEGNPIPSRKIISFLKCMKRNKI